MYDQYCVSNQVYFKYLPRDTNIEVLILYLNMYYREKIYWLHFRKA